MRLSDRDDLTEAGRCRRRLWDALDQRAATGERQMFDVALDRYGAALDQLRADSTDADLTAMAAELVERLDRGIALPSSPEVDRLFVELTARYEASVEAMTGEPWVKTWAS